MSKTAPDGTAFDLSGPDSDADGAPAVVLIHGLGLCREIWAPFLPDLATRYRVINYDLFGHGDSAPCTQTTSLAVYAKQIADLMDFVDCPKAAIVGFSIGGMINRRFAMDYPEKVSALAILNSPHNRGEEAQQAVEQRALQVKEAGAMATMDDALKRWFTPAYLALPGSAVADVKAWRERVDAESYAGAAWVLANGVRELINPQPAVACQALVMTSENDSGSTPTMSEDIAAEIAGAELQIVPGLKHLGLMEAPGVFSQPLIGFLDSVVG